MKYLSVVLLALALVHAAPIGHPCRRQDENSALIYRAESSALQLRHPALELGKLSSRSGLFARQDDGDDIDDDSSDDAGSDAGGDDSADSGDDDASEDGDDSADTADENGDDSAGDNDSADNTSDAGDDGDDGGDDDDNADDSSSLNTPDDADDSGDDDDDTDGGLPNTTGDGNDADDADDGDNDGDSDDGDAGTDDTDNSTDNTNNTDDSADNTDDADDTADNTDGTDDSTDGTGDNSPDLSGASNSTDTDTSDSGDDSDSTNSSSTATPSSAPAAAGPPAASSAATSNTNGAQCAQSNAPPNAATLALIEQFEGFVPSPKPDPIGLPTVGFGHKCVQANCAEVPFSFPLSQTTATQLLASDASKATSCLQSLIGSNVVLNDNQFGALTSFTFNLGCGAFSSSTMRKRLNAGEDPDTVAAAEIPRFNQAGGKALAGLTKRRAAEVQLFQTPSDVTAHPLC